MITKDDFARHILEQHHVNEKEVSKSATYGMAAGSTTLGLALQQLKLTSPEADKYLATREGIYILCGGGTAKPHVLSTREMFKLLPKEIKEEKKQQPVAETPATDTTPPPATEEANAS
jgi:hypothetical protein